MPQILTYIINTILYVILVWIMKIPAYSSFSEHIGIIPLAPIINSNKPADKPNIIILMADDLGWNDVSFHGSDQIPTPNIDAIAYNGIILNDHYVGPSCTSTRSSLLTGKYFFKLGMQHGDILEGEPRGLPLEQKLLPQYLREAGYKTYAVGKWQLGFHKEEFTPPHRGFDYHYGFWTNKQDYYSHMSTNERLNWSGYDMRSNMSIDWSANGTYTTDLFTREAVRLIRSHNKTDPLFLYLSYLAPHAGNKDKQFQNVVNQSTLFSYIKDPERRSYAEKVSKLDQSVGNVIQVLHENKMLQNSVILFLSDNGAQTVGSDPNKGSNYPLRGVKGGPWEGSSRSIAVFWSPFVGRRGWVSRQIVSVVDWFTTLLYISGANANNITNLDGVNIWPSLSGEDTKIRTHVVLNIDEIANYSSIRFNNYKLIKGTVGNHTRWYGETGRNSPIYSAKQVLQSKAGVAIANVVKTRHTNNLKDGQPSRPNNVAVLSESDIHIIRKRATIQCGKKPLERPCNPSAASCLFDILSDPCETNNIAEFQQIIVRAIEIVLNNSIAELVSAANLKVDPKADPKLWDNAWVSWLTKLEKIRKHIIYMTTIAAIVAAVCGILLTIYCFRQKYSSYSVRDADSNSSTSKEL